MYKRLYFFNASYNPLKSPFFHVKSSSKYDFIVDLGEFVRKLCFLNNTSKNDQTVNYIQFPRFFNPNQPRKSCSFGIESSYFCMVKKIASCLFILIA